MKKIILLAIFTLFAFVACNKNVDLQQSENLQWSEITPSAMNWNNAMNYCKNLNERDHNDWHLPTISELRTLIQNCKQTETGGECKVSDNCRSYSECGKDICDGCIDNNGKYNKLGETTYLWSSSVLSDNSYAAWGVNFKNGHIGSFTMIVDSIYRVRCVRKN